LRTPLYYAVREGRIKIIKLLLRNKAFPWGYLDINYESCTKSPYIRKLIWNAKKVWVMYKLCGFEEREKSWEKLSR